MENANKAASGQVSYTVGTGTVIYGVSDMYDGGDSIVIVTGNTGSEGGGIQLFFNGGKEFWLRNSPLSGTLIAEYIPQWDNGRKWLGISGTVEAVVSAERKLAIVAFTFMARRNQSSETVEVTGRLYCNAFA
ncbi:hypothetical protein C4K00_0852 [Pseudomonas synxantha]|uniref:hypothetical protein n=1 Tax=Pseudomonas synxantha TaxID=47883 RepID=UPI000F5802A1|nr:hypothetical protein [Pseudomonas synxantha]AZE71097.1 hypothetical protein C4K00_0852 [Pseudomonas synxantha]MDQ0979044.1 hypothetical protein [Pseudomonas synxantha]